MRKFDTEVTALRENLVLMGELAEAMVAHIRRAIGNAKLEVGDEVRMCEERLDQMQILIDGMAVRLLTVYGPVAADLRYILTVSHVTTQLERIGDQTVNICEALELLGDDRDGFLPQVTHMAEQVEQMLNSSLAAYFCRNSVTAEQTIQQDDLVDSMNDQITKSLLRDEVLRDALMGKHYLVEAVGQILIAHALERIGDHATNICEEVVYMVRGDDIRHAIGERSDEGAGTTPGCAK